MILQLNKTNTALIVIDVQTQLLTIMDSSISEHMITNINMLSQMFSYWQAPIILTEQYKKGLGATCEEVKPHLSHVEPIEKLTFGSCGNEVFQRTLKQLPKERNHLIVVGMETHICVLQTVLQLLAEKYQVFVPIDAVQSTTKLRWQTGIRTMEQAGAVMTNTESLLFQITQRCDSEDFKKLLPLIKAS
ncbi:MAG: isochorismatase family protein [SAR324 cluster bacterium]|nr:isochorismatase family protein [SAR324 cluster bacterium]